MMLQGKVELSRGIRGNTTADIQHAAVATGVGSLDDRHRIRQLLDILSSRSPVRACGCSCPQCRRSSHNRICRGAGTVPSRKRQCQASSCNAAASAHSRRSASFAHSAFQPRASAQFSSGGHHALSAHRVFAGVGGPVRAGTMAILEGRNAINGPCLPGNDIQGHTCGRPKGRFTTFGNGRAQSSQISSCAACESGLVLCCVRLIRQ